VDVAALLNEVMERRRWSLAELAARAGTSRGALWRYSRGAASPSVRTLTRILAAADLQLRVELEPLLAPLDARLDAMLSGTPAVDTAEVKRLMATAETEQSWGYEDPDTHEVGRRSGRVTWALDGATALNVHGLACDAPVIDIVLVLDDAGRAWLTSSHMRGTAPGAAVGWWACSLEEARRSLQGMAVGRLGMLRIRLVDALPAVLDVRLAGSDRCVPVVTVDEVETAHPDLAEVLARLRSRRAREGRT
jgi:transcriptional regulator with XRE-family HTH domain